jgi:hypothetical protein
MRCSFQSAPAPDLRILEKAMTVTPIEAAAV